MSDDFKSGFVAVVGRPNVGKSTLLNTVMGQKIAIVSDKPQTTRTRIMGVFTNNQAQILFIDTPGIHKPLHKLGEKLVQTSQAALYESDVIVWVVDASEKIGGGEEFIARNIAKCKCSVIMVLNKIDKISEEILFQRLSEYNALANFTSVVPISAKKNDNIDILIAEIIKQLPVGPQYYPEDMITDQPERVIAAEIIREKVLHNTNEEIPHAIAVVVEDMKLRGNGDTYVNATIYVERETQKGMVIGAGGKLLKLIGQQARTDIELMIDGKAYLELWVKVKKDWRNRDAFLRTFGYSDK